MALTAFLCSGGEETTNDRNHHLKYMKMSTVDSVESNGKKYRGNPLRNHKPRGNDVQIIQYSSTRPKTTFTTKRSASQTKTSDRAAKTKKTPSINPQQSIGTLANGIKENGARLLYPFKKSTKEKKIVVCEKNTNTDQKSVGPPHPTTSSLETTSIVTKPSAIIVNSSVSFDSGNEEDFSSSCGSSVVPSDAVTNGMTAQKQHQMESIPSEGELSPGDEDNFMDALSDLNSDEEYVTPPLSRSHSVTNLDNVPVAATDSLTTSKSLTHYIASNGSLPANDENTSTDQSHTNSTNSFTDSAIKLDSELCESNITTFVNTADHQPLNSSSSLSIDDSSNDLTSLLSCRDVSSTDTESNSIDMTTASVAKRMSLNSVISTVSVSGEGSCTVSSSDSTPTHSSDCDRNGTTNEVKIGMVVLPSTTSPGCGPCCLKHPLVFDWVLWYDKITTGRPQSSNYAAQLKMVSSISSVEEFWSVFNHILPPSMLEKNSNYHFFKTGIWPLWEDAANKKGGKWVITFKNGNNFLDKVWLEVLMALIGEQFNNTQLINGVVLSRRKKGDRIAVWTTSNTKSSNFQICEQLVRVLGVVHGITNSNYKKFRIDVANDGHGISLVYMLHKDSMKSGTSYQNQPHWTLKQTLN